MICLTHKTPDRPRANGHSVSLQGLSIDPLSFVIETSLPSAFNPPPPLPYLGFVAMASTPGSKPFAVYFFSDCSEKKVELGKICQPASPALNKCLASTIDEYWGDVSTDTSSLKRVLADSCTGKHEPRGYKYSGTFIDMASKGKPRDAECTKRQRPGPCTRDMFDRYEHLRAGTSILTASTPSLLGETCYSSIEDLPSWAALGYLRFERKEGASTVACNVGFFTDSGGIFPLLSVAQFIGDPVLRPLPDSFSSSGVGALDYTGTAVFVRTTPASLYAGAEIWLYLHSNCKLDREDDCHTIRTDFPSANEDIPDNCVSDALDVQTQDAKINRDDKLGEEETRYRNHYENQCLDEAQLAESFHYAATTAEHNYTLFQYDQVGNIVEVVPPKGVTPLTDVATRPTSLMANTYKYDSRENIIEQASPDTGSTIHWYNSVGHLRFAQTAGQKPQTAAQKPKYSYKKYDKQGRVTETGETEGPLSWVPTKAALEDSTPLPGQAGFTRSDITEFLYDRPPLHDARLSACFDLWSTTVNSIFQPKPTFLRGRLVAAIRDNGTLGNALTCYNYDASGLLITLVQHTPQLGIRRLDHTYDRATDQLKSSIYQGAADQNDRLYSRNEHDADHRLIKVFTSRDGSSWEQDAHYQYYPHGPLRRIELGANRIQGQDFAWTLHGWVKAVNRDTLDLGPQSEVVPRDIGKDGAIPLGNPTFARDVFGFSVGYYDGDYKSIQEGKCAVNLTPSPTCWVPFKIPTAGSAFAAHAPNLYDGTISHTVVANRAFLEEGKALNDGKGILGSAFRYDQLYRLVAARVHGGISSTSSSWTAASPRDGSYDMTLLVNPSAPAPVSGYDSNGNIQYLQRNGVAPSALAANLLDDLAYEYKPNTNQLIRIEEKAITTAYIGDIEQQPNNNYAYDANGNLKHDLSAGISGLLWNSYGRLQEVQKSNGEVIKYIYDANQQRVGIARTPITPGSPNTIFVRDQNGRMLAAYKQASAAASFAADALVLYGAGRLGYWKVVAPSTKYFELTDHTGSVLASVSGNRLVGALDVTTETSSDFYPFGMEMPGRSSTARTAFGYHSHERADEGRDSGTGYVTGSRTYDGRIGRWWSVDNFFLEDPTRFVGSYGAGHAYSYAFDNPVMLKDFTGKAPKDVCERSACIWQETNTPAEIFRQEMKAIEMQRRRENARGKAGPSADTPEERKLATAIFAPIQIAFGAVAAGTVVASGAGLYGTAQLLALDLTFAPTSGAVLYSVLGLGAAGFGVAAVSDAKLPALEPLKFRGGPVLPRTGPQAPFFAGMQIYSLASGLKKTAGQLLQSVLADSEERALQQQPSARPSDVSPTEIPR